MNIYIVFGVVLIAAGTISNDIWWLSDNQKTGQGKHSRNRGTVWRTIKKSWTSNKAPPSERPPGAIKEFENEYQEWVKSFQKTRKEKLLDFQKRTLEIEKSEVEVSKIWKPVYENFLNPLKEALLAYKTAASPKLDFDIPDLPEYLISKEGQKYEAAVTFSDNVKWKISLVSLAVGGIPVLKLTIYENSSDKGSIILKQHTSDGEKIALLLYGNIEAHLKDQERNFLSIAPLLSWKIWCANW